MLGVRGVAALTGAALATLCAAGVAAASAPGAPAQAQWTSTFALAAALGATMANRRVRSPRTGQTYENDALLSIAGDFVLRHRIDGRVTAVEGDGASPFATSDAELLGYGLIDRLHEDDRLGTLDLFRTAAADGKPREKIVRLRRAGDDGYGFAEVKCRRAAADDDGVLISAFRFTGAALDLAAQLEAAREEARLEKSLKDRLLANMSHELRTPLNAILGFSEILGDSELAPADVEKRIEYARIIHSSADHLLSVVNLVLDMSRIEAGKFSIAPEPLELEPLIRECCDMLRLRADAGRVRIVQTPLAEGLEVIADKRACRQIIVNLLSNAVKFTRPDGCVTIDASVDDVSARISVADTGIGIKPADLPRLGDPFFQIKSGYDRGYEGAGLGLSLVRGLVGLHDGSLIMESAFGVGTRVTAILPLASRPAGRRVVSAPLQTTIWLNPPNVAEVAADEERRIA